MSDQSVNILLSTFNGETYLWQQFESFLAQEYRPVVIHLRDDASNDKSVEIASAFAGSLAQDQNIQVKVEAAQHLGVVESFFELLKNSDPNCAYYAFADQDDVWLDRKLSRAVAKIKQTKTDKPLLYFSRLHYVDKDLNSRGLSVPPKILGLGNALVNNVVPGCSLVMNKALRDLLVTELPQKCLMHDWWVYLVASAMGEVIFDSEATILYRQHDNNVVGGTLNPVKNFYRRMRRFMKRRKFQLSDQAAELLRIYGERMSPQAKGLVENFVRTKKSFFARVFFALNPKNGLKRQSSFDNLLLRFLIIIGRY